MSDLPAPVRATAEKELGETPSRRRTELKHLRRLIAAEEDFNPRQDEAFLLRFLRSRKFDSDRAFNVLKNYYRTRLNHPTIYGEFYPSAQKAVIDLNLQTILKGRDRNGCAVFVFKGGCWDPKTTKSEDIFKVNVMFLEQSIRDPITQVNGICAIMDMKHYGLLQLRHSPPAHLQKVVQLIQDCFPARFKAIHIVHEPTVFGLLFGIVKRFLNTKLQERIHFHGSDHSSLHEHIPAAVLPAEYGGALPPMSNRDYAEAMLARDDEFKSDLRYGFTKKDVPASANDGFKDSPKEQRPKEKVDRKKILSAATTG